MTFPDSDRPRAKGTLYLVGTFVLGMVAGAALLHIVRASFGPPPGGPPAGPPLERLARDLDLTPAQVEQVRTILVSSRERLHGEAEATRARIREVLTFEQKVRFDAMRPPRPPPPPPGFPPPEGPPGSPGSAPGPGEPRSQNP